MFYIGNQADLVLELCGSGKYTLSISVVGMVKWEYAS